MKKIVLFSFFILGFFSGFAQKTKKVQLNEYTLFGEKFAIQKLYTSKEMMNQYKKLKKGDTIAVQFISKVNEVCKKKGCWMNLSLPNSENSFVRFKDYSFFVPLNCDGSSAIVSGKAFLDVVSVEELKHFAKDGKKSQQEIDAITKPKITYAFQATGVLLKKI
ncbi:MAG: DUF4920 domain-containing protein [Limnohabitans sp.]|nr:DUF4920 domain-containing protein [Limnohabitans sp.]